MIEVKSLTKFYGKKQALDNVSFEIPLKSSFAVIGENGAGKSTFINILSGFVHKTSGEVIFRKKSKLGVMPQDSALEGSMTCKSFLVLISGLEGRTRKQAQKEAMSLLEKVKLENEAKDKAAAAFMEGFLNPPLLWKPCVHCGYIQSWAQKFYIKNRVASILGIICCISGSLFFLFFLPAMILGIILCFSDIIGIVFDFLVGIPLLLAAIVLFGLFPLLIVFNIISTRRFKKRLKFWLDHPNYSGPREPAVQFCPPYEDARHHGHWEVLDPDSPRPFVQAWKEFRGEQ